MSPTLSPPHPPSLMTAPTEPEPEREEPQPSEWSGLEDDECLGSDVGLNLGHSLEEAAARLGLPEVSRNLSLAVPGAVVPICVAVVIVAWLTCNTVAHTVRFLSTAPLALLAFVAFLLFWLALVYLRRR